MQSLWGNTGETSERQDGVHMGFTERIDELKLNWHARNYKQYTNLSKGVSWKAEVRML